MTENSRERFQSHIDFTQDFTLKTGSERGEERGVRGSTEEDGLDGPEIGVSSVCGGGGKADKFAERRAARHARGNEDESESSRLAARARVCGGRADVAAAPAQNPAALAGPPDPARRYRRRCGAGAGAGCAGRLGRARIASSDLTR